MLVFWKTLLYEFHISFSHTEWYLPGFFCETRWSEWSKIRLPKTNYNSNNNDKKFRALANESVHRGKSVVSKSFYKLKNLGRFEDKKCECPAQLQDGQNSTRHILTWIFFTPCQKDATKLRYKHHFKHCFQMFEISWPDLSGLELVVRCCSFSKVSLIL